MKNKILLFSLMILLLVPGLIQGEELSFIPEDRSIYFVLNRPYKYGNGSEIKILKLDVDIKGENKLRTIEYFTAGMNLDLDYHQEYEFMNMQDADDTLYLIKYFKPWETRKAKTMDIGLKFPFRRDNQVFLGRMVGKYLNLLNIDNLEEEYHEITDGSYGQKIIEEEVDNLGFYVRNGRFGIVPTNEPYPYQPPDEIVGDADSAAVVLNDDKYRLIQLNTYDDKQLIKKRILTVMNKETKEWKSYDIKGKRSWTYEFPPFVIYRIGTAKDSSYPVNYTGEFVCINYITGDINEFYLEPPSNVYYTNVDCIIAKSKDRVVYLPIIEGKVLIEESLTIYEDVFGSKEEDKKGEEIVEQIEVIFLGPKEVPEEIMIEKARKANQKGEELYHDNNNHQAIDYFILATEYYPEHAQAYSNLGLTYLKIYQYDQGIKASLKAIELTENDTIKASSYYNIAKAYEAMEDWERALENYRKALEFREHDSYNEGIERLEGKIN